MLTKLTKVRLGARILMFESSGSGDGENLLALHCRVKKFFTNTPRRKTPFILRSRPVTFSAAAPSLEERG
jgi:hypothetical protein